MTDEDGQSQGIKSLSVALQVLSSMAARSGPATLSEIARDCDMPPSKVHRYLATFVQAGMMVQEGRSGRYDLGPGALKLGLAALERHDFVNRAADGLPGLALRTGMTALLAVWGNQGATVVRWERGVTPTVTSMGLGTTLPLLNSATGRVFLAWAPAAPLRKVREAELRRIARSASLQPDFKTSQAGIDAMIEDIRARGFASVDGRYIPGLVAAAAPILDWQGEAQAAITLVGTDPATVTPDAPEIATLREFCAEMSVMRAPLT